MEKFSGLIQQKLHPPQGNEAAAIPLASDAPEQTPPAEVPERKESLSAAPLPRAKYEMNLAEFPISILSKRFPKDLKYIEYQDTIIGKDNKPIARKWTVYPSSSEGFGTTQLLDTLFEIFQIWREQRFASRVIQFDSLYSLLKRRGLKDKPLAYERLKRDLTALMGIEIHAQRAFWDNERKAYVDAKFHLFDAVYFWRTEGSSKQQPLPLAHIRASEELFGSVQANALATLLVSSKQFHSYTPTEQRLALYLGKMLYKDTSHRREVIKLAQQLPIHAQAYKKVKQQLTLACDGLLKKGYPHLGAYHYEPSQHGPGDNIVFSRAVIHAQQLPAASPPARRPSAHRSAAQEAEIELLVDDILAVCGDTQSRRFYRKLAGKLDPQLIYKALSDTKDAAREGIILTSPGRYFTDLVKRYTAERGITL
jgi:hypothetical protein